MSFDEKSIQQMTQKMKAQQDKVDQLKSKFVDRLRGKVRINLSWVSSSVYVAWHFISIIKSENKIKTQMVDQKNLWQTLLQITLWSCTKFLFCGGRSDIQDGIHCMIIWNKMFQKFFLFLKPLQQLLG